MAEQPWDSPSERTVLLPAQFFQPRTLGHPASSVCHNLTSKPLVNFVNSKQNPRPLTSPSHCPAQVPVAALPPGPSGAFWLVHRLPLRPLHEHHSAFQREGALKTHRSDHASALLKMPQRLPLRFEQNPHSSPLSHAWLPAALPSCPPHCSPPWLALFLLPPGLSAFALAGPSDSKLSEAQPCCFHTVSWTDPRPPVSSLARPSPPLPGRGAKAAADALRCTEPRSVQLLHRRLQPLLLTAITDKRPRCLEVGKAS